jgi:molybdopterin-guanine dinucleotide biosynthesis protein A
VPSAAILSGGRATRYGGRDKSAIPVAGRTILERQLHELAAIADDILVVGRGPGRGALTRQGAELESTTTTAAGATADAAAGPQSWKTLATNPIALSSLARIRYISDRVPGCGPLGGLDAALAAAAADRLILVAGDMPFVTAAFLQHLLALTEEADAVVPRTEDGYHPLCAAYTRACHPVISRRLAQHCLTMTGLLDEVRTRVVDAAEIATFGDPARLLANVNTPAALNAIEALLSHEA